ncbi:MAG: hypothetical protein O3A21_02275 [Proteobacteria bacterium]|nr:hypothetical protein [Pseudomonadota bacterium]
MICQPLASSTSLTESPSVLAMVADPNIINAPKPAREGRSARTEDSLNDDI